MGEQQPQEEGGVVKRRKVAAAAADVTMDLDILDCPVCFLPLRPPVFQVPVLTRADTAAETLQAGLRVRGTSTADESVQLFLGVSEYCGIRILLYCHAVGLLPGLIFSPNRRMLP
jgi:hypothetical protein